MKETQPLATLLAKQVDTSQYYAAYTADNECILMPKDEPCELVLCHYKKKVTPDVGASTSTGTTSNFESLRSIRWIQQGQQDIDDEDEPKEYDTESTGEDN